MPTWPLLALAAASCAGCATLFSESVYPVLIDSEPREATFVVRAHDGSEVRSGTTPATIMLDSDDGFFDPAEYVITFEKPGYRPRTARLEADFDPWYFANVLFGGLLGLLIVDPATGAMWQLEGALQTVLTPVEN